MAVLLRRGLAEDGYLVDLSATGPEALRKACELDYDAIVLDVMLPGMSGIEVCLRLRQRALWVPVLLLTAGDALEVRVRGLDAGADDYMVKPFRFDELSARVDALIRRGPTERRCKAEVTGLRLDPTVPRRTTGVERAIHPAHPALPEQRLPSPCEQNISGPQVASRSATEISALSSLIAGMRWPRSAALSKHAPR
jgi:two-component system OmpR family response regulator